MAPERYASDPFRPLPVDAGQLVPLPVWGFLLVFYIRVLKCTVLS